MKLFLDKSISLQGYHVHEVSYRTPVCNLAPEVTKTHPLLIWSLISGKLIRLGFTFVQLYRYQWDNTIFRHLDWHKNDDKKHSEKQCVTKSPPVLYKQIRLVNLTS